MEKNTTTRKWLITINNPLEKGYNHDTIKRIMQEMKIEYGCISDEKGLKEETYHTHVFLYRSSPIRFNTLKKKFDGAHFDMAKGTSQENREYVLKTGKWANTSKEETRIDGTQEEFGECPLERQGQRNDIVDLYDMIKEGKSDYEILEENPQYLLQIEKVEKVRQTVIQERFKNTFRNLEVSYIWGTTGAGKTRSVMEKYGYENVFRVTDYQHPFDNYKGQDVLVFEEFRSSARVADMLNYLDGYPLELPCRYANKYACYTKVYIITNIPLGQQYPQIQLDEFETFKAFLRRIHYVYEYTGDKIKKSTIHVSADGFLPVLEGEINPFEQTSLNLN